MKHLLTTTALGLMLGVTPALAQTGQSQSPTQQPETQQMQPDSNTTGQPGDTMKEQSPTAGDTAKAPADAERASELIGMTVENAQGDNIGEINDILLSKDGTTSSVLLGTGGFLGMGEKSVAVDFSELNITRENGSLKVTTTMSAQALEAMPAYESADQSQPTTGTGGTGTGGTGTGGTGTGTGQ